MTIPPLPHFRADEFHPHVLVVRLVDAEAHIDAVRADERRNALEEAAQACTSTMLMNVDSYCGATAHACAVRIRALIDKEPT